MSLVQLLLYFSSFALLSHPRTDPNCLDPEPNNLFHRWRGVHRFSSSAICFVNHLESDNIVGTSEPYSCFVQFDRFYDNNMKRETRQIKITLKRRKLDRRQTIR